MGCAATSVAPDSRPDSEMSMLYFNWQDDVRIVLIGKSGVGKSETGSGILMDRYAFKYDSSFCPVTDKCTRKHVTKYRHQLVFVTDTPGITNASDKNSNTREILKCLELNNPGPNIFLLVLRADVRFTSEDVDALNEVEKLFGEEIYKYLIIVFTRGKEFGTTDRSTDEKLKEMPAEFQKLYQRCRGRYVAIENPGPCASDFDYLALDGERQRDIRVLFEKIRQLLCDNNWSYYSTSKGADTVKED